MITIKKVRLHNPTTSARQRTRSRANRSKNPSLITLGFLNPEGKTMKKAKKSATARKRTRRANPAVSKSVTRRRKNPFVSARKTRRRRNPSAIAGKTSDLAKNTASALIALVLTRQIPQALLKEKNTGVWGYVATAGTMLASSYAMNKALGTAAGHAALIGGSMQLANRLLNEYISPVGKVLSLSGVGDATAASLGDIQEGYFPLPVATTPTGEPIIPRRLQVAAPAPVAAPTATVSGIRRTGRFASRF